MAKIVFHLIFFLSEDFKPPLGKISRGFSLWQPFMLRKEEKRREKKRKSKGVV